MVYRGVWISESGISRGKEISGKGKVESKASVSICWEFRILQWGPSQLPHNHLSTRSVADENSMRAMDSQGRIPGIKLSWFANLPEAD